MASPGAWWQRLRAGLRGGLKPAPVAIPDGLWHALLERHPFLLRHGPASGPALRALSAQFLAEKQFEGAGGLVIDDAMALAIAAQACLPLLGLAGPARGLACYDDFVGIVVHPGAVRARRNRTDELGIAHQWEETLSGEAMDRGPVMLSWADVADAPRTAEDGYNVVIHEFVHKIDLCDGEADGCPPLYPGFLGLGSARAARAHWNATLQESLRDLRERLNLHERFGGPPVWLDPYGASGADELFPVAAEAYFVNPRRFEAEWPALHALLDAYFRARSPAG